MLNEVTSETTGSETATGQVAPVAELKVEAKADSKAKPAKVAKAKSPKVKVVKTAKPTAKDKTVKAVKQGNGKAKGKTAKVAKVKQVKAIKPSRFRRHPKNPFHPTSAYGKAVDIIAAHPAGIQRDKLLELFRKETAKDERHCGFDLSVIYSSIKGHRRHTSCQKGFDLLEQDDGRLVIKFK